MLRLAVALGGLGACLAQDSTPPEMKAALRAFKARGDPDNALVSWDPSTDPCGAGWDRLGAGWVGVTCDCSGTACPPTALDTSYVYQCPRGRSPRHARGPEPAHGTPNPAVLRLQLGDGRHRRPRRRHALAGGGEPGRRHRRGGRPRRARRHDAAQDPSSGRHRRPRGPGGDPGAAADGALGQPPRRLQLLHLLPLQHPDLHHRLAERGGDLRRRVQRGRRGGTDFPCPCSGCPK